MREVYLYAWGCWRTACKAPILVTDKSHLHWKTFWPHAPDAGDEVRPLICRVPNIEILLSHHRFDIEPFFFSSFLNWIPSRFQADFNPGVGDSTDLLSSNYFLKVIFMIGLTITLTFLRSVSQQLSDYKAATQPYYSSSFQDSISSADSGRATKSTLCSRPLA